MALCEKILITGFSGSGKTSLLKAMEESAPENWTLFDDLDDLILQKKGPHFENLGQLIAEVGWEKFRLWERQELEGWLKEEGRGVLALGGGTLSGGLLEMLRPVRKIRFLFVNSDFDTCWERLIKQTEKPRPLTLRGRIELEKIYQERMKYFETIDWKIENPDQSDLHSLAQKCWEDVLAP